MKNTILVVLVIALLAATACVQRTDLRDDAGSDAVDMAGGAGAAGVAGEDATATVDETASSGGVKDALKDIFDLGSKAEFQVTYDMQSTYDGQTETAEMSLYVKGDKSRIDSKGSADGQAYESRTFVLNETKVVVCGNEAGWKCFALETPQNESTLPTDLTAEYEKEGDAFWNDLDVDGASDRMIAGTKASCFKITTTVPGQGSMTEEVCYSKEGVPLYMSFDSPMGTVTQEATSYSTRVSNSDFEPPVEAQSFEDMMADMMNGMEPPTS